MTRLNPGLGRLLLLRKRPRAISQRCSYECGSIDHFCQKGPCTRSNNATASGSKEISPNACDRPRQNVQALQKHPGRGSAPLWRSRPRASNHRPHIRRLRRPTPRPTPPGRICTSANAARHFLKTCIARAWTPKGSGTCNGTGTNDSQGKDFTRPAPAPRHVAPGRLEALPKKVETLPGGFF